MKYFNKFIEFSKVLGSIGTNPETGKLENSSLETEVRRALSNLDDKLKLANIKKTNVMKCTVFLTTMDHYGPVNTLYAEYFEGHRPARSCVAVKELPKGALFEIEAIGVEEDEMSPKL